MSEDALGKLKIDKSRRAVLGHGNRNRFRTVAVAVVLAAIVIVALLFFLGRPVVVETVSVSQYFPTQSFTLLNSSGYVVAQRKAAVASKTTGRLEWIGVEEGSRVTGGQIIARLENKDIEATVRQAEAVLQSSRAAFDQSKAELADAGQSFRRQKELLSQGIVSRAEYDSSEARFKSAAALSAAAEAGIRSSEAALRGAKVNLDYSLIRAPFDAVVLTKNADVGDIITPLGAAANAKAAVVTIADLSSLLVEADVSESNLYQVKKGQPCEIMLDALPGSRFSGIVHTIVPTADRSKASVMIKIRFLELDARIYPEMSAKVAFLERAAKPEDKKASLVVNSAAIVIADGREGVYLVSGQKVVFTPVIRGSKMGDLVEVSGLKSGDRIVIKPLDKLKNGTKISLPEKK